MTDSRGVKAHGVEGKLHDRPHAEGEDQRADADRAAQKPADERGGAQQRDAHGADRDAPDALGEADEERVARAAAERGGHIEILRVGEDDEAEQHHRHAREQRGTGLHQTEPVEEVHGLADDDRVDEHGDADRLAQKDVDDEDGEGDRDGGRAVEDAERFGRAEIQHLPRADADVCLNGEIDSEAVDEERDRREEHIQQNRAGRGIVPQRSF